MCRFGSCRGGWAWRARAQKGRLRREARRRLEALRGQLGFGFWGRRGARSLRRRGGRRSRLGGLEGPRGAPRGRMSWETLGAGLRGRSEGCRRRRREFCVRDGRRGRLLRRSGVGCNEGRVEGRRFEGRSVGVFHAHISYWRSCSKMMLHAGPRICQARRRPSGLGTQRGVVGGVGGLVGEGAATGRYRGGEIGPRCVERRVVSASVVCGRKFGCVGWSDREFADRGVEVV